MGKHRYQGSLIFVDAGDVSFFDAEEGASLQGASDFVRKLRRRDEELDVVYLADQESLAARVQL